MPSGALNRSQRRDPVAPGLQALAGYGWRLLVLVAAAYLIVRAVAALSVVVIPVVLAVVVAAVLSGPVRRLRRAKVPASLAAAIVLLGALAVLIGAFVYAGSSAGSQFEELSASVSAGLDNLQAALARPPLNLDTARVSELRQQAVDAVNNNRSGLASGVLSAGSLAVNVVAGFLLFAVVLFFFLRDGARIWTWLVLNLPHDQQGSVDTAGRVAARTLSGYVSGTAFVALVDAVLIGLALLLVGVPLVVPLALLTFISAFIPVVGAVLSGLVAVVVALVSGGPTDALIIAGVVLAVQQVEGNVLQPMVMSKALSLHPLVVLIAFSAGSVLAGLIGALFSVPFVAVISNIIAALRGYPPFPPPGLDDVEGLGVSEESSHLDDSEEGGLAKPETPQPPGRVGLPSGAPARPGSEPG
ncbi:MAG: AI-2E family transporter [Actinomycetota bacterium]|nr:AI-2E family transporter [Actinomycetota bacterium]